MFIDRFVVAFAIVVVDVVFIGTLVVVGGIVGRLMSIRKGCTTRGATKAPKPNTKCRACKYGLDFFPQMFSRSTFPPVIHNQACIIYYYFVVSDNIHTLSTEGIPRGGAFLKTKTLKNCIK